LIGSAKAPGTCGELVEGTLDGKDFLITCPVDIWSEIKVEETEEDYQEKKFSKTVSAVELAVLKFGNNKKYFKFERNSSLPLGKGMGSSTADISAAVQAVARALGKEATSDEIVEIALSIEPSDALMYPGIYLFDHKKGSLKKSLGEPLPIDIVVIDPGGEIDTLSFNNKEMLKELNLKKEPRIKKAACYVMEGHKEKDPEKIGRGATISSFANQEILYKPQLEKINKLAEDVNALGVNIAHSGTVMGILLSPEISDKNEVAEYISKKIGEGNVFATTMIGGGVK
jgi:L-threonine kinase